MGHHQQWIGGAGGNRSDDYFGLHPDSSDALDALCVRGRTSSPTPPGTPIAIGCGR